jgi:type II secretory pathway pseudopilin PulG
MRIALIVVAGLALIGFLVVAVVLPQMSGAEAKEAAQALIAGTQAAQQQVSAAAEKAASLENSGNGVKVASKADGKFGELKWVVEAGGTIRGWNEKNAIEISLRPALQAGKVSWTCRGYPIVAMPASCGGRG